MIMRMVLAAFVAVALTACDDPSHSASAKSDAANDAPSVSELNRPDTNVFDPELMRVVLWGDRIIVETAGHASLLKLDASSQQQVERAFASFGEAERSDGPGDCPAGPLNFLEYPNRLKLAFQDGKFVGFWADERSVGVATPGGVKPGSPRTALGNAPHQETSFGKLVIVDGAFAILDEAEKRVTDIYAGAACIYD